MTESSLFWGGVVTGDCGPYNDDQFSDFLRVMHQYDRTVQGVLMDDVTALNLETISTLHYHVNDGYAMVDGKFYKNDGDVGIDIVAPGSGTNYYTVVLRKDFVAQTVRVVLLGPSLVSYPAVTQTDGTTWEIEIWQISITSASVVTKTDKRCPMPSAKFFAPSRLGGSSSNWYTPGDTEYVISQVPLLIQMGCCNSSTGGPGKLVTFPVPYQQNPIVLACPADGAKGGTSIHTVDITGIGTTTFSFRYKLGGTEVASYQATWIAIGYGIGN